MSTPDIFLSYSRNDVDRVRMFADAFEAEGFKVWWDSAIRSGAAFDQEIEAALRDAKAVVVLWSKSSVASRWVRAEATVADRNQTLAPVMIETCERPIMFELTQTAELSHWDGTADDPAWNAFVADVRKLVSQKRLPHGNEKTRASGPALEPLTESTKMGARGSMPSLAILPFTNRSGIEDDDIFAEGMVEDIVAALSQSAMLRVLGSISTAHLKKGTFTDLAAVSEQLGVRYLLEGNVRRAGESFKVTTQLIAPATGELIWTGQFARPLADLQELQEELVTEVAAALDIKIQNADMERALRKPADLTAWEAVQRSLLIIRRFNATAIQDAVQEARRAVELAPDFAMAHANFASLSANLYFVASPDDPDKIAQIHDHARMSLELDPDSAETLQGVANAYVLTGKPEEGLPWAKKAYQLAPNNGLAAFQLGTCYSLLRQFDEAMKYLELAISLMPGSHMRIWPKNWQSGVMIQQRNWSGAEELNDECLSIDPEFFPAHMNKAYLCWRDGRHKEANQALSKLQDMGVDRTISERIMERTSIDNPLADDFSAEIEAMWTAFESTQN